MIEDKELRELFKVESDEHIQRLEAGFLRLEAEPGNAADLEELFREAHTLKGAARTMGLTGVETLSHQMENIIGQAGKGSIALSSEVIDLLCSGLDAIRKLVNEAVTGEPSGVILSELLAQFREQITTIPPASVPEDGIPLEIDDAPPFTPPQPEPENRAGQPEIRKSESGDFRIDTMRVETSRLDKLMSQLGELNVTKLRISQRVEDMKGVMTLWEAVSRNFPRPGAANGAVRRNKRPEQDPGSGIGKFAQLLGRVRSSITEDSTRLDLINNELADSINRIRLLPLSTIFNLFQRLVRDLAKEKGKEIRLVIEGGETSADKRIIEEMKDPLMHMLRNAVDHGIETPDERERNNKPRVATITLKAHQTPVSVMIEVSDDGQGLDLEAIKRAVLKRRVATEDELNRMPPSQIHSLIFLSGVTTSRFLSDVSGRGVGLDVVRANVERLKGTVTVESFPGTGCSMKVQLPLTLATTRVMLVTVNRVKYAVPVEHIQTTCLVLRKNIFTMDGRRVVLFNGMPVPVADLSDLLELQGNAPLSSLRTRQSLSVPCIILSVNDDRVGILADELIDEQEIVLKQYSTILKRVRNISGATILGTGEVCMVLNPFDLIKSVTKRGGSSVVQEPEQEAEARKSVLVAEDSITVRTQMKRILEGAGYEVVVAIDGLDAFNKLAGRPFDALVSDVMMPNMTGLELTEKVRQNRKYREIPIILVTSLASDEDKQRGLEAGANAYITKPSFDQKVFLETVGRLI